jgi:hypothetical protein
MGIDFPSTIFIFLGKCQILRFRHGFAMFILLPLFADFSWEIKHFCRSDFFLAFFLCLFVFLFPFRLDKHPANMLKALDPFWQYGEPIERTNH